MNGRGSRAACMTRPRLSSRASVLHEPFLTPPDLQRSVTANPYMKGREIRALAWRWPPSNNAWTTKEINGSAPFNHLGRVNEMLGRLIISKATYALLLNLMRSLRDALLEETRMISLRRFRKIPRFMCRRASVFTRTTTDLNYLWI